MTVKIALLALVVILAATTIVASVATVFNEAPLISNVEPNLDGKVSDHLTLCNYTEPQGKDKDGGWP